MIHRLSRTLALSRFLYQLGAQKLKGVPACSNHTGPYTRTVFIEKDLSAGRLNSLVLSFGLFGATLNAHSLDYTLVTCDMCKLRKVDSESEFWTSRCRLRRSFCAAGTDQKTEQAILGNQIRKLNLNF